jgi:hypothetical protein
MPAGLLFVGEPSLPSVHLLGEVSLRHLGRVGQ